MENLHQQLATLQADADATERDQIAAHLAALWQAIELLAETVEPRNSL